MSYVAKETIFSDVEELLTQYLKDNLTDPIIAKRASGTPFVVIGAELQRKIQYPHVIIQIISSRAKRHAMSSNALQWRIVVQVLVKSKSKEQANGIKDDIANYMRLGKTADFWTYKLYDMQLDKATKLPFSKKTRTHGMSLDYSFLFVAK